MQSTSESAAESAQNENMHSIRYADSSSADCDAASHGTANENASASVDTSPTHAVPEDSGQNNGGQNNNDGNTPANISTVQPVANAFTSAASSRSQPPSTPTPSNEGRGNKRPNQSISHAEKRRLCEISDDNPKANHKDVAFLFHAETGHRVERSTVTRILQRKVFWKNAGTRDCNRKRIASSRFPTIEEALYELVRNKTRFSLLRVRLTDKELVKYSKQIAETMRKHYGSTVKTSTNYGPHLKGFRGSLTWVSSFKKRNAISPPEDVRSFSSGIYGEQSYAAAETLDIWNNELKIEETKELLSNWTRLEDVYFLDATVLATSARPEHACPPGASQQAQDAQAAVDEVLGFIESQGGGRNSTTVDLTGSGPPSSSLNFPLPSVPSAMDVLPEPTITNILSHEQSGVAFHTSDPFTAGTSSSAADQASATPLTETRHSISENSVVTVLFCNNGVGNDRRAPWMIGRKAFRKLGREEGQIWHDCPVRYFHNAQGWLTARLVRKWVEEFDKSVDRSVVILTSLLNACDLELLDLKHVTVVPIPRTELGRVKEGPMLWNCGSASPFHHGVEQMFRAIYRGLVVERALQYIDEGKLIKAMSMQGAARMINEAWEKVPLNVVRKCWRDLGFMPARFQRTYSRPRANSKAMWGQSLDNLSQLLSRYRDAIPDYPLSGVMDLSQSDVDGALTQRCDYLWLDGEQSVFHPMGSVLDFVRSVHVEEVENEVGSDDEMESNRGVQKGWGRIEDHVTALEVVNRLADFMNCDAERDKEHCLYLVGSLQLEIKRLHDLRQNEAHARKWNGSNGKNAS